MNEIAKTAKISSLCDIETSSRGSKLIASEGVTIDSFVKIKFVGGLGNIEIGENSFINSGCVLYSGNGIRIGKNVLIAANCTLAPVNHEFKDRSQTIISQRFKPSKGGIIIEDDVWVGSGVIILDGAIIKKGSVIGAGCIVNMVTEEHGIYTGNPLTLKGYRK
ncbi:MAG: putative acetyltransferase protein [Mucilaginibacter sp.]|nr:putative acetyltransferase protein [Mucilaginibacter sp.]